MDDQECFKYIIVATVQQDYFGVQATDDNRCFWLLSSDFWICWKFDFYIQQEKKDPAKLFYYS